MNDPVQQQSVCWSWSNPSLNIFQSLHQFCFVKLHVFAEGLSYHILQKYNEHIKNATFLLRSLLTAWLIAFLSMRKSHTKDFCTSSVVMCIGIKSQFRKQECLLSPVYFIVIWQDAFKMSNIKQQQVLYKDLYRWCTAESVFKGIRFNQHT